VTQPTSVATATMDNPTNLDELCPGATTAVATRASRPSSDYSILLSRVRKAQLLERRGWDAAPRMAVLAAMMAAGLLGVALLRHSWWELAVAGYLALVLGQLGFLGHDAGHQQIFRTRRWNDLLGRWVSGLGVGLSYGWWIDKHTRHHRSPNCLDDDPDVQRNILAWTDDQAAQQAGMLARIARHQGAFFFPLLLFEAFNLHVGSARSMAMRLRHRTVEFWLLVAHVTGWAALCLVLMPAWHALAFLTVQQAVLGLYLGCSFAPNHKGMPIFERGEQQDFFRRQVLSSRNIAGGRFVSVLFGGLNYQIEHHLFPSMPRSNMPQCRQIVRAYCAERGVSYCETTMIASYRRVLTYLNSVAPLRAEDSARSLVVNRRREPRGSRARVRSTERDPRPSSS
jgi:fatty acid desaturase